jgi:NAD(P)-dependent dehydrogenase (short-subunit alcohol dehydrogenase family)
VSTGNEKISAIVADLSLLGETRKACMEFLEKNERLDFLCLNANAISNERTITSEGFEKNYALGFLSRVIMTRKLQDILEKTRGSQVLSVVGLNRVRPDFDDLTMQTGFSGRKGLGRWQWAVDLWSREFNKLNSVPVNLYMPGLVKPKILANEPQPMRALVKVLNLVMGISVYKSAENIFTVMNDITFNNRSGVLYSYIKIKQLPKLEMKPDDTERLWCITETLVKSYL